MATDHANRRRAARRIALSAVALGLLGAGARAEGVQLATLGPDGAATPGDRMTVTRPFGAWTLQCDLSVSQNRRLCAVEQVLERPGGAVLWRLARATDESNVLVWSLPLNLNTAQGLTMKLDGFATTISAWTCQTACLAIVPLTPTLQSLLFAATTVELAYTTNTGTPIVLTGTMAGFKLALRAAAEDPFGKRVPPTATGSVRAKKP